jgi:peptidyl-prolyl cis-trans isomerase A (cyclophilin A)
MRSVSTALCLSAAAILLASPISAQKEKPIELPKEPGLYAIFDTTFGTIVARLYEDKAPNTVKNFVALAEGTKATLNKAGQMEQRPYYNGLTFHRVVKDFMIQAGDVKGTGSTPCGIPNLRDEIDKSLHFNREGKLAMANTGRPNSASCQFFITVGEADYLDGKFTMFGEVVSGQDVAERISRVPALSTEKPMLPVTIKTVTIRRQE